MHSVSFTDTLKGPSLSPLWRATESYLSVGSGKTYKLTQINPGNYQAEETKNKNSLTALKVLSYVLTLGILPLLAAVVRGAYRASNNILIPGKKSVQDRDSFLLQIGIKEEFTREKIKNYAAALPKSQFEGALTEMVNENQITENQKQQMIDRYFFPKKTPDVNQNAAPVIKSNARTARVSLLEKTIESYAKNGYVAFYKSGPTAFLGNFYPCENGVRIEYHGARHTFKNAESAFHWQKYMGLMDYLNSKGIQFANQKEILAKINDFKKLDGEGAFQFNRDFGELMKNTLARHGLQRHMDDFFNQVWDRGARDIAMHAALDAKFSQNPHLRKLLEKTGNAYLLEHNSIVGRDTYWSDNHDGTGANRLGQLLMEIRGNNLPKYFHVSFYSQKAMPLLLE